MFDREQIHDIFQESIDRSIDEPAWFYEHVLRFPGLPWQIEASEALMDVRRFINGQKTKVNHDGLPRISIRSCHGPGKTQLLAMIMHLWNFTTRGKIACTAPKEAQLLRRLLPRYRRCMRDADQAYKDCIQVLGREVRCFGDADWGAVMETASDPDNLAGYHDDPQLFLVDEGSARRLDPMYPVIEGALTTPGSVKVEIGNPTRIEGEFYNHHCKEGIKQLYYRMHVKASDAPKLISKEWLKTMGIKYGKTSPIYLIRAAGEFAAFDDYILIPLDYFEDAIDVLREGDGSIPKLRVSIDVADGGNDATVVTAALHYSTFVQVLAQRSFYFNTGESPIKSAEAGMRMFDEFNGQKNSEDDMVVDGLGCGAGTVGYLMKKGYNVINYKGGSSSNDPEQFRCLRVETAISLYNAYKEASFFIAPDAVDDEEELRQHVFSVKRNQGSEKFDDIMPKHTIPKSPDRFDSLQMQYVDRLTLATDDVPQSIHVIPSVMGGYNAGLA